MGSQVPLISTSRAAAFGFRARTAFDVGLAATVTRFLAEHGG